MDSPGPGVQVIAPLSPLLALTNPVLIDGLSEPGYAGSPLIELNGNQAGHWPGHDSWPRSVYGVPGWR
jgi:hypothetical protein